MALIIEKIVVGKDRRLIFMSIDGCEVELLMDTWTPTSDRIGRI